MPESDVPPVSAWFQDGFHRFLRRLLRSHFYAIAIERRSRQQLQIDPSLPLIVYGNHPAWWDPLIAHFLNHMLFGDRQFYAPIDAEALQKYRVFGKLGFYGVRLQSTRGAAAFLKQSRTILNTPGTSIWMTPEGRFSDIRDHEAELMPGLPHLCSQMRSGYVLPLALEYVFWDERLPLCLAKAGQPIDASLYPSLAKGDWSRLLGDRLRSTQRELATLAIARSSEPFDNLLVGGRGAGAIYDAFRRLKSWLTGERFDAIHGEQFK
jgi:1-acyl-sn-glycerol-3-phosphate acyltransferase